MQLVFFSCYLFFIDAIAGHGQRCDSFASLTPLRVTAAYVVASANSPAYLVTIKRMKRCLQSSVDHGSSASIWRHIAGVYTQAAMVSGL
jgi:hypothetical protein